MLIEYGEAFSSSSIHFKTFFKNKDYVVKIIFFMELGN